MQASSLFSLALRGHQRREDGTDLRPLGAGRLRPTADQAASESGRRVGCGPSGPGDVGAARGIEFGCPAQTPGRGAALSRREGVVFHGHTVQQALLPTLGDEFRGVVDLWPKFLSKPACFVRYGRQPIGSTRIGRSPDSRYSRVFRGVRRLWTDTDRELSRDLGRESALRELPEAPAGTGLASLLVSGYGVKQAGLPRLGHRPVDAATHTRSAPGHQT